MISGICQRVTIEQARNPEATQRDVAECYALALMSPSSVEHMWPGVNLAIRERWPKGLVRVKRMAWKLVEESNAKINAEAAAKEGARG